MRSYEVERLVALAISILFIGVYLGELARDRFAIQFIVGAAGALGGFFILGRPYRPRAMRPGDIALRYYLPAAVLLVGVALRLCAVIDVTPVLFVLAAIFVGREVRARALNDWRLS